MARRNPSRSYHLYCMICGPLRHRTTYHTNDLVAMQEHLMRVHEMPREIFRTMTMREYPEDILTWSWRRVELFRAVGYSFNPRRKNPFGEIKDFKKRKCECTYCHHPVTQPCDHYAIYRWASTARLTKQGKPLCEECLVTWLAAIDE